MTVYEFINKNEELFKILWVNELVYPRLKTIYESYKVYLELKANTNSIRHEHLAKKAASIYFKGKIKTKTLQNYFSIMNSEVKNPKSLGIINTIKSIDIYI